MRESEIVGLSRSKEDQGLLGHRMRKRTMRRSNPGGLARPNEGQGMNTRSSACGVREGTEENEARAASHEDTDHFMQQNKKKGAANMSKGTGSGFAGL